MLGDGGVIDSWREEHGKLARGAFGDVDLIKADAVFADHLQPRRAFGQDGVGSIPA